MKPSLFGELGRLEGMMVEKAQRSASCVNLRGGSVERTDWRRRYCVMITSFIGIFASGAATLHFGWVGSQYFMKLSILFASILKKRKKFGRRCEQLSASLVCAGVEINLNFCAISLLALRNFNKFCFLRSSGRCFYMEILVCWSTWDSWIELILFNVCVTSERRSSRI